MHKCSGRFPFLSVCFIIQESRPSCQLHRTRMMAGPVSHATKTTTEQSQQKAWLNTGSMLYSHAVHLDQRERSDFLVYIIET